MFYNDVRFPTVYHWIDSCNFFMLSYQASGYTRECIRIDEIAEITLHQSDSVEGKTLPPPLLCMFNYKIISYKCEMCFSLPKQS